MSFQRKVLVALGIASIVAVLLFIVGALRNGSLDYWYLVYNLVLAYIPLGLMLWIKQHELRFSWRNWRIVALGVLWLLFLPNSFYIVTDFIHLYEVPRVDVVQDIVMLTQFSIVGILAGFLSLSIFQALLLRQLKDRMVWVIVVSILYLSSLAIYLGRELRWNSWDIVLLPGPVLRDTLSVWWTGQAFWMTASFFVSLVSLYLLFWAGAKRS